MGNTKQQEGRELTRMMNWNMQDQQMQSQEEGKNWIGWEQSMGKYLINQMLTDIQKNDSQPEHKQHLEVLDAENTL